MQKRYGIDVSEHQGMIDWAKVKSQINFAIIRGGYSSVLDSYAVHNLNGCRDNKIPCGVYWFSYATNEQEAISEAKACLNLIKAYTLEYPVYFDFEYDSVEWAKKVGVEITKDLLEKITTAFCETIENAGYHTGIYTNLHYYNSYFKHSLFEKYAIWVAHWGVGEPFTEATLWQDSSSGSIKGINGRVDTNICFVDFPKIMRDNNLNHLTENPEPKPSDLAVGDTVRPTSRVDYNGATNDKWVLLEDFEVVEVSGDRVVIAMDGTVTGVWNKKDLRRK